ncbi:Abi family protein [Streptomyces sp. 8L]|uniref:Abi family protein n=1 Tax=Streptomyces sp. 8L TaxID=2877242 RepID=UPI001CD1FB29|nr:Abi family protein [Streptomyces sp. 8L]MCA1224006.1 Abi family protein [Streptomyces sp. 8L]
MPSTSPGSPEPPADKAVTTLITPDRLKPYLDACAGNPDTSLALYRWNSDLAAAFFEQLGHLEIMLRNALDARLVARQHRRGRSAEWYNDPSVPLSDKARADIIQAHQRLRRGSAPIPRGKVIAELSFGFWRFLLARQYTASLWPDLAGAFPRAPTRALNTVEDPVKRLHKFRNRIAHHEGIWHLPLEARRDDIHTVLGFIAPAAAAWVAHASRIDDILARRPSASRD